MLLLKIDCFFYKSLKWMYDGVHAKAVNYHAHSVITSMRSAQAPPPGTAARASLSYLSTKLERTLYDVLGCKKILPRDIFF